MPPAIAVIVPDVWSIIALAALLLLQVPPMIASVNVVVDPAHNICEPLIVVGTAFIVTVVVAMQPVGSV